MLIQAGSVYLEGGNFHRGHFIPNALRAEVNLNVNVDSDRQCISKRKIFSRRTLYTEDTFISKPIEKAS